MAWGVWGEEAGEDCQRQPTSNRTPGTCCCSRRSFCQPLPAAHLHALAPHPGAVDGECGKVVADQRDGAVEQRPLQVFNEGGGAAGDDVNKGGLEGEMREGAGSTVKNQLKREGCQVML
jgi:hypothetical protein